MIKIKLIIPTLLLAAVSCTGVKEDKSAISTIDIAGSINSPEVDNLEIEDLRYVPLDTATNALMGRHTMISGVVGDTIFVTEVTDINSRVLMFSEKDGRLIGTFDHKGQGPGEYNWVEMVAVDAPNREIIIKGSRANASRYTLNDSLVNVYEVMPVKNRLLACGSVEEGINITENSGDDFVIRQFDGDFNYVDSIVIKNFDPGYHAGSIWSSSKSTYYLDSRSDTLWHVTRGALEPLVVTNRGGKVITPEIEKTELRNDYKASEKYITINAPTVGDDYIYCIVSYGGKDRTNVYRMSDGALVYKRDASGNDEMPGIELTWGDAKLHAFMFYYANGRWYALIDDSESIDADGNPNDEGELNKGLVSFRIK